MKKVLTMVQAKRKYSRALPFVKVLDKSKPSVNKSAILKNFPDYVTDDIVEILHNILIGKLSVKPSQKKLLAKNKKKMHEFANLQSLKKRRNFIYKQKGGFLGAILPVIASVLGNLFS
jgi:hypothetical protein